ncbi:MAG: hypothetical protein ABIO70_30945 [Pseudomonadota bacterium]
MRSALSVLLPALLALTACKPDPRILEGHVSDVFGKPIADATVLAEGWQARGATDAAGLFKLEVEQEGAVRFVAGADGYVRDQLAVTIPPAADEAAPMPEVQFALWPKPEHVGFYGKGHGEMVELPTSKVSALGSDLSEMHGIRDLKNTELPRGEKTDVLFSSTLRASEISQLDLKLYKLKYLESVPFKGITGEETIEPKFWVADVEVPFTLRGLYADDIFVITPDAALEPGSDYAFAYQGILVESDPGSLERIPLEQRKVYPFAIAK